MTRRPGATLGCSALPVRCPLHPAHMHLLLGPNHKDVPLGGSEMRKLRHGPSQLTLNCIFTGSPGPRGWAELVRGKDATGPGSGALKDASFSEDRVRPETGV